MGVLWQHWSWDPFLAGALLTAAVYEVGLRRLRERARPGRTAGLRRRAVAFYLGLVVLVVAVMSPLDYWADVYFYVHMAQHVLLMFAAPALLVMGAPWLPLQYGLPRGLRRVVTRTVARSPWCAPVRAVGRSLRGPWVSVALLNLVMLAWHLPSLFTLAYDNQTVHVYGMHASMFLTGVLFFLQVLPSPPFRLRLSPVGRIEAVFVTSVAMWFIAMALGVFATGSWYGVYAHQAGVTLPPLADQRIGAGILWICGDLWAIPVAHHAVRELLGREQPYPGATERLFQRSRRAVWAVGSAAIPRQRISRLRSDVD